jgi:hypothetical protein
MSLNIQKLEKARRLEGGIVQARCPACAEGGKDRTGEHLRVYPDGKFGCCVHPKDKDHRKRIFALAGVREHREIRVNVAKAPAAGMIQPAVLGRLGRVFSGPTQPSAPAGPTLGTLGTGQYIYTCERKKEPVYNIEEFGSCVPSVPTVQASLELNSPVPSVPRSLQTAIMPTAEQAAAPCGEPRLPYLTAGGGLVIPFDAPERYHWWKGGQSVAATMAEVRAGVAHNGKEGLCR